jgi:hypothetical protein
MKIICQIPGKRPFSRNLAHKSANYEKCANLDGIWRTNVFETGPFSGNLVHIVAMLPSRLTCLDLVQIWLKGGFLLNQRTHFNKAVGNETLKQLLFETPYLATLPS